MRRCLVALAAAALLATAARAQEVPRDHLLPAGHRFALPARECLTRLAADIHQGYENAYLGDGVWAQRLDGNKPWIRWTAYRVIGYLEAYQADPRPVYLERARQGLDYLLAEQRPEGVWPWYSGTWPMEGAGGWINPGHCQFITGTAAGALAIGYEVTHDRRYLAGSARAARWEMAAPVVDNNNYNMFAVWHLAMHYRLTGDRACLESAIYKTREGGLPGQLAGGGWPGHNSKLAYHGLIIRGLAELWRVLPDDHAFRPQLRAALVAAVNRVIGQQAASGAILDPDGQEDGHNNYLLQGLCYLLAHPGDLDPAPLRQCIAGLLAARAVCQEADQPPAHPVPEQRPKMPPPPQRLATVWQDDFETFEPLDDGGRRAPGWSDCACVGWSPAPGAATWEKTTVYARHGAAQLYRRRGSTANSGMFIRFPIKLTVGRQYLFSAQVMAIEDPRAHGCLGSVAVSAQARPGGDMEDACHAQSVTMATPLVGRYQELLARFRADAEGGCACVWLSADGVPDDAWVGLVVDDARLYDEGPQPPPVKLKTGFDTTDLMAVGAATRVLRQPAAPGG
jgi:hypothetical protein